jgi:hypothetical protein
VKIILRVVLMLYLCVALLLSTMPVLAVGEDIATFGLDDGDSARYESGDSLNVMQFRNTAGTGILTDLELLVDDRTPKGKVRLGVYADINGRPGDLLLDAGEVRIVNGWVSISVWTCQ